VCVPFGNYILIYGKCFQPPHTSPFWSRVRMLPHTNLVNFSLFLKVG
jgi:hypothetical protein